MSNDAYSVAIRLRLIDGVTTGLRMISGHFKSGSRDVAAYEASLLKMAKAGALAGAGIVGLRLFKTPIEDARKYQTELAKIGALGLGSDIVRHADAFARSSRIIGNSATDMARAYGDALSVFKRADEADMAAPIMAKLRYANMALYGEAGEGRNSATLAMLKTIESRGGTRSQAEFAAQADAVQKVVNASGGRVDGRQWLQVMQTGGILAKQMANSAFYLKGEPLVQEVGGFRFGTGLNALYSNFGQGRGSIASQQELFRLGMIDPKLVQFNKLGKLKKALPGAFRGMDALINGNVEGLVDYLLPIFSAHGIRGDKAVLAEMGMIASNSRGASLLGAAYLQREKLAKQSAANASALGINATVAAARGTAKGQEVALLAKEQTLKTQIGLVVLPAYVKALELANGALGIMGNFATKHKAAFGGMVTAFATLSAGATIIGTVRVLSLLSSAIPLLGGATLALNPVGLAVLGISAAAGLLYANWDRLKGAWTAIKGTAETIGTWISQKAKTVWAPFQERLDKLGHVAQALGFLAGDAWKATSKSIAERWSKLKDMAAPYLKAAQGVWDSVTPYFSKFWKWIGDQFRSAVDGISGVLSKSLVPALMGATPQISALAGALKALDDGLNSADRWAGGVNRTHKGGWTPFVAPRQTIIHATIPVHVGNRHVVTHVVKAIARDASRPNTGTSSFNGSMSPPSVVGAR